MFRYANPSIWNYLSRLIMVVGLLLSVILPLAQSAQAAEAVPVSGRVYNAATGSGYGGVVIDLCGSRVTTSATGSWSGSVAAGAQYCARMVSGAPAGAFMTRNTPDVGAHTTYEYQVAGKNCYHVATCTADQQKWDRPIGDSGLDFIYGLKAQTAAPTPAPAQTPAPTPAPASNLAAPVDFKATAADDMHVLNLAWRADEGANPSGYVLERSMDNQAWVAVGGSLTATTYKDEGLAPGVHYYYRLRAVYGDKQSEPVLADASTPAVASSQDSRDASFTSSDEVAVAHVSSEELPASANCHIDKTEKSNHGKTVVVAGLYQLKCDGDTANIKTVRWEFKLGDKTRGLKDIVVRDYSDQAKGKVVAGAHYNEPDGTMRVQSAAAAELAVMGTKPDYGWIGYAVVAGVVIFVLMLLALVPIRMAKKRSYQDYLRSKYYNL